MFCLPGAHKFEPHATVPVIFCERCGAVRALTSTVEERVPAASVGVGPAARPMPSVYAEPLPVDESPEQLDQTIQELEADVLDRLRDAMGQESFGSILERAGIDPNSAFARSVATKVGAREVGFTDAPPPQPSSFVESIMRGNVSQLSDEERALIEASNRHPQQRVTVEDTDRLEAGL